MGGEILKVVLMLFFAALVLVACSERPDESEGGRDATTGSAGDSRETTERVRTMAKRGTLSPGRYSTAKTFEPPFFVEVGRGWRVLPAPGPYSLRLGYLAPGREVAEGKALRFLNVQEVFEPAGERSGEPTFEARPAPEELVSWFQRHPYLKVDQPEPAETGGVAGERFEANVDVPEGYRDDHGGGCPLPCVPLFRLGDDSVTHATEKSKDRFIVLENVRGETVVVIVSAPANGFDEFSPRAQEVLDTVKWEGA
jgi:hypothetical protein